MSVCMRVSHPVRCKRQYACVIHTCICISNCLIMYVKRRHKVSLYSKEGAINVNLPTVSEEVLWLRSTGGLD